MATHTLDITKDHCPMTFVKTKLKMAQIAVGDILEVLLVEGEPLDNVPRAAIEQGYNVLSVTHVEGNVHKVTILKQTISPSDTQSECGRCSATSA